MDFKKILFIGFTILVFIGCGAKKQVYKKQPVEVENTVEFEEDTTSEVIKNSDKVDMKLNKKTLRYIDRFASVAVSEMNEYHIPASITLAQGILESGNGQSDLVKKSNNHFGIKCHKGWTGEKIYYNDDEQGECFRKYKNPNVSYRDHSLFLTGRKRYANLFKLRKTDYKRWANGLVAAGYATDKRYAHKLLRLIRRYNLYELDIDDDHRKKLLRRYERANDLYIKNTATLASKRVKEKARVKGTLEIEENESVPRKKERLEISDKQKLRIKSRIVKEGEESGLLDKEETSTKLELARDKETKEVSTAKNTTTKEEAVENTVKYHIVKKGDTLYSISRKYNLTIEKLRELNNIKDNLIKIEQRLLVK